MSPNNSVQVDDRPKYMGEDTKDRMSRVIAPLTAADRAKRYREKKKLNKAFREKERERKRKSYVPVFELTESQLSERRKQSRQSSKTHYYRKKLQVDQVIEASVESSTRSSGGKTLLKLRFPFKNNDRKRKRSLEEARLSVKELTAQNDTLSRENKRLRKRIERQRKSQTTPIDNDKCTSTDSSISLTPSSQAKKDMISEGINPEKHSSIRKKLTLSNAIQEDLKNTITHKTWKKSELKLKCVKKYRCINYFAKTTSIDRRALYKALKRKTKKSSARKEALQSQVVQFLEREDNATVMPGKKDTVGKSKTQKLILNDFLHNLYAKFKSEHPEAKLSKTTFCNMRPKHILLANFSSRRTCLCSRHQNMALKLRSIHQLDTTINKNPDVMIQQNDDSELKNKLEKLSISSIKYVEWKRVEGDDGKFRWKQVDCERSKEEFVTMFMQIVTDFREHVRRVKIQYSEVKKLREGLPKGHVLVWMDFAENYQCSSLEEVQSAYWNAETVTLHTTVVYLPASHQRTHISIVGISETPNHNASTVYAMIKKLIPSIKEEYPIVNTIHYLTDSPTSQYRNKSVFKLICDHDHEFGISARWHYLEAGHGKGPCDGLGASIKRSADMGVKQGKCVIQSAEDFHSWSLKANSSVKYYFVSNEEYERANDDLQKRKQFIKAVPKTMKIHSAVAVDGSTIAVREVSCNCSNCLSDVRHGCQGWEIHSLSQKNLINTKQQLQMGRFVIAEYDNKLYIGQLTDQDTDEVEINFMHQCSKNQTTFKWPSPIDKLWVNRRSVIQPIEEPEPCGKSRRFYKVSETTVRIFNQTGEDKNL